MGPCLIAKGLKPISCKWYLKPKGIHKAMWKDIRCILSWEDLLKNKTLLIRELFLWFIWKTPSGPVWDLWHILILIYTRWMSRWLSLKDTLKRPFIWCSHKGYLANRITTWSTILKSPTMDSSRASYRWDLKFHLVILSFKSSMKFSKDYLYHKISRTIFIFLVLYIDDILLTNYNIELI